MSMYGEKNIVTSTSTLHNDLCFFLFVCLFFLTKVILRGGPGGVGV